ncbi:MAG: type II secretion system protein [Clostridia bacterium]|nr:type II secretion system protein [Clostridia bacterium]
MKKNNKKGFTIVELVIVIAVIAILAAVLIPTFSGIVKKSRISSDTTLVRNINTALATEIEKHETAYDAIKTVEENGYSVEKLTPTTKNYDILWDSKLDRFVLVDDEGEEVYPDDGNTSTNKTALFKIYDSVPALSDQSYSIYLKENPAITTANVKVGFDAGRNTGINVNLTELSGEATIRTNQGNLTINAANATVYHYGEAGLVDIIAVDGNSYYLKGAVESVIIKQGHFVAEAGSSVKVLAVDNNATNVVLENKGGQIDKAFGGKDGATYGDVEVEYVQVENIKDATTGFALFAGGEGTEANPYVIETAEQAQNISTLYGVDYNYYKVADGVTALNWSGKTQINMQGSFDGNGVAFDNVADGLFGTVCGETAQKGEGTAYVKNLTVNFASTNTQGVVDYNISKNFTMENVTAHGYLENSYNAASFIDYAGANNQTEHNVALINCNSDMTIVITQGGASAMIGHFYSASTSTFTFTNCSYTGNIFSSSGANKCYEIGSVGGREVIWNGETVHTSKRLVTENAYAIKAIKGGATEKYATFETEKVAGCAFAKAILTIGPNGNGTTVIGGYFCGDYMTEDLIVSGDTLSTEQIKFFDITSNGNATSKTGLSADGKTFNIVNSKYNNEIGGASVRIIQYNDAGLPIAITTWKLV